MPHGMPHNAVLLKNFSYICPIRLMSKKVTIVVPIYNSSAFMENLLEAIDEQRLLSAWDLELVLVDDGSKDNSWNVIEGFAKEFEEIKGIQFNRNYGKSAALNVGFKETNADVVITMDADLQDSPDEIPELYQMVTQGGFQLVSGWKKKRHDPLGKTIPSRFFNLITRLLSGIKIHDFNCGLKAYKNVVVKNVEVSGEMHRYIPVLAKNAGFNKIGEKIVQHQSPVSRPAKSIHHRI